MAGGKEYAGRAKEEKYSCITYYLHSISNKVATEAFKKMLTLMDKVLLLEKCYHYLDISVK